MIERRIPPDNKVAATVYGFYAGNAVQQQSSAIRRTVKNYIPAPDFWRISRTDSHNIAVTNLRVHAVAGGPETDLIAGRQHRKRQFTEFRCVRSQLFCSHIIHLRLCKPVMP